jgi:RNA polymerase sigma factor (sigma-70 family)
VVATAEAATTEAETAVRAATARPIRRPRFAGREAISPLLLRRLSDEQLGSRLASGEAAAFDELYRRYVHRLSAYGAHLLGDAASGDDLAQSALLKAYGALRDGRVPDRIKPWLYRIAHNAAIDLISRRRELPFAELPEDSSGGGEHLESSGALLAALASLPERQRRVYVLRELHGLRIDETAAELRLSTVQVEQALFVARNRLAEHLVFGERLNCIALQRLAMGPLDASERRALKTHLRSCTACRSRLGLRGRALELMPVASLDWLRWLTASVAGGGAPVAAKVGAVVATATFAAGVPIAADEASHRARPIAVPPASHTWRPLQSALSISMTPRPSAAVSAENRATAHLTTARRTRPTGDGPHDGKHDGRSRAVTATEPNGHSGSDGGGSDGGGLVTSTSNEQVDGTSGADGHNSSSGDGHPTTVSTSRLPPTPTTATHDGGDQVVSSTSASTTAGDSGGSPDDAGGPNSRSTAGAGSGSSPASDSSDGSGDGSGDRSSDG